MFLIFGVVFLFAYLLLGPAGSKQGSGVELLLPKEKRNYSPEKVKEIADQGMESFLQDTHRGYLAAQTSFVKVLEADPTYEDLYSLLCVTYYRLWPFVKEKNENMRTVRAFLRMANQYDSKKINYGNCKSSYLLINNSIKKALLNVDAMILKYDNTSLPPTISYFYKIEILMKKNKFVEALAFAEQLNVMWPDWMTNYYLLGALNFELKKKDEAISSFKKLIENKENDKKAKLYVGMMRNVFYKQYQKSIDTILSALLNNEIVIDKLLAKANYYLADSYLKLNASEEAAKYVVRAYELDPLNKSIENLYVSFHGDQSNVILSDRSYLAKGDYFRERGDCNAAQAYYKEAIKVNSQNIDASLRAANCLWKLGLSQDAIQLLQNAIQINASSVDLAVQLAKFYIDLYNFNVAQEVLNIAHKKVKGHYEIYRQFAELELRRNNPVSSIKYAEKALEEYSDDIPSMVVKSKSLILMQKYQEAYSEMSKALELDSEDVNAQVTFSEVYYYVHGAAPTLGYLNKLINLHPTEKEFRNSMGKIYLLDEQFSEAEKVFYQLKEIDDKYKPGIMGLAKSYKLQGRLTKAQKMYFKAVQLDPADVAPLLEIGLLYLESKNFTRALKQFVRITNINKNYPKIDYYIGKTYFLLKNFKEAISWANQAKIKNSNDVDAYLLAGEVYEAQGLYQFCSREYQQAMQYREFGPYVYLQISRCYSKSGALDIAITMLEKARKLEAGLPGVYRELGAIYELKNDTTKALWAYEYYLSLAPNAPDASQVMQKVNRLR